MEEPVARELLKHKRGGVGPRNRLDGDPAQLGEGAQMIAQGTIGERGRAHDHPIEVRGADQGFLAVLVLINPPGEETVDDLIVEESAVALRVAGADARDGDEAANPVMAHGVDQITCRVGEERRRFVQLREAERIDDGLLSADRFAEFHGIERIALDDPDARFGTEARTYQGRHLMTGGDRLRYQMAAYRAIGTEDQNLHTKLSALFIPPRANRRKNGQSKGRMQGSDREVVAQVQQGDRDAFRILVERHSPGVFRLAFRMVRNETEAEDLVQESFIKAYKAIAAFDGRSSFTTWLYRITSNCALDYLRARRKPVVVADLPEMRDGRPGPERAVMSGQMTDRLATAMEELSEQERAAFVLRHFENWSIAEISASLNLRENATKHSIFRAVRKLREALEPAFYRVP